MPPLISAHSFLCKPARLTHTGFPLIELRLLALYLKLAGDYRLPGKLGATKRSMVCCCLRSDNAFSTDASRQVCIAIRCVLLGHLSQGKDRCPGLQYQARAGGRGVRLSLGPPFGAPLSRALRGLYDVAGECYDAVELPLAHIHRSCVDRVLFAILSRRLLILSSTEYDDLWLPRLRQGACVRIAAGGRAGTRGGRGEGEGEGGRTRSPRPGHPQRALWG